jgi:hypothetical protein
MASTLVTASCFWTCAAWTACFWTWTAWTACFWTWTLLILFCHLVSYY